MSRDRALRAATIAIVLVCGAIGIAMPRSILFGGCAWLVAVGFALSGWGWLAIRVAAVDDVDFGLRAMWGAASYLAIAGVFIAVGICSRPIVLALLALGFIGFAWREWTTAAPLFRATTGVIRSLRERPLAAYAAVVIGAAVALHIVGAIVHLDRNPWDDDIAYTPLLERLLQAGDLVEPFSFRRLASYGGQTALQALVGARGNIASVHALDQGLSFALVVLMLVGHARSRRVPSFWLVLLALVLLLVPDLSINTASYWSGVAAFYALYRTIERADSRGALGIAAVVAAATCTLRMNYLAAVVPFVGCSFAFRARGRWRHELRLWRVAFVTGFATLLPWMIAAYLSSRTFMFPLVSGTFNHALSLQPSGWTWTDELGFVVSCCIEAQPIVVMPFLYPLFALADEHRAARPFASLLIASTLGFLLLAHSFTTSDANAIWRYAFGYTTTVLLVFAIESVDDDAPLRIPALARWILLAAVIVQLAMVRGGVTKQYTEIFHDMTESLKAAPGGAFEAQRYREMQAAVPAGAKLVVMLDDPAYLDFRRNTIFNLDTAGWASPLPQMPSFSGSEALRSYFLELGIRHVAFVRGDYSRYFNRRDFWVWRLFNDEEVFRVMSAYMIDTIDTLGQLAERSTVLYDRDGLVVIDLEAPREPAPAVDPAFESVRREAFVRRLADSEHLHGEWTLSSRQGLLFLDGMTGITYPDVVGDPHWYEVAPREPVRGTPIRWLQRRVHFRVRADSAMHLLLRGQVSIHSVYTRPRLDVSLSGVLIASVRTSEDGSFVVDITLPAAEIHEWTDLYAIFDAVGSPEREMNDLRVARLEEVVWEPR